MRKYVKKIAAITMAAAIVTGTAGEIFLQDPVAVCAAAKEMGPNKLQLKKVKDGYKVSNNMFSLKLPAVWKKAKFSVRTSRGEAKGSKVYSFVESTNAKKGYGGVVFNIEVSKKKTTYGDDCKVLAKKNKIYYTYYRTTDVEYNNTDKKLTKNYKVLEKSLKSVIASFKVK